LQEKRARTTSSLFFSNTEYRNSMSNSVQQFDVVVLGGGAAGLMCAFTAGQLGKSVLVLEVSNKLGKKILMSGGGRCNFTNLDIQPDNYLCHNPHFFKSALQQYTQWDFISLVNQHGIDYHEKELGQLFCDHSSKDILNLLITECEAGNVEILLECGTETVNFDQNQSLYQLKTEKGLFACQSLVVATGGLSIPSLGGATGFAYKLAEQFGLKVLPRTASLVPFTLTGDRHDMSQRLSGVSLPVTIQTQDRKVSFSNNLLFTHRGLSGPAVLQISNYWQVGEPILIDLLPGQAERELVDELLALKQNSPTILLNKAFAAKFPKAFVQAFFEFESSGLGIEVDKPLAEIRNADLENLASLLKEWRIKPSGTEGYRTAEVTKGGVDVTDISSKTMQVKHYKGLYFIGEALDVTAHLGGYNFQWAWSSGYVWC